MLAGGAAAAFPLSASARDADLVSARRSLYPAAEVAAARASDADSVQGAYDAARDLQEAVRRAAPVSAGCRPLRIALGRYAAGRVLQMEGVDRPSASDRAAGRRSAERARAGVAPAAGRCRGRGGGPAPVPLALSPGDGEATFGAIVARAPQGADTAALAVGGQAVQSVPVRGGTARFSIFGAGRQDLRVVFSREGRPIGARRARGAILLPRSALSAAPGSRSDPSLTSSLARAIAGGPRYRAAWVQDLTSGEVAGVNATAAFPAASTVKLGLLAGSLARLGPAPERTAYAGDLRAMITWSSNLATNRLLRRLGGTATATDGLRRLGARSSTFTGEYIVGTELQPALPSAGAGAAPPRTSSRVTTAEDLARMLFSIHAAATGAPGARAQTGLTAHQARLALGWLLSSQQRGGNASLLSGGAAGSLVAQKNGWIRSARHAAGVVYTPRGPAIAVLLSYDASGVSLPAARSLGSRVAALASALP